VSNDSPSPVENSLENTTFKIWIEPGTVAHTCNTPATQEAEAGGSQVQDQPGLHSETPYLSK
jgi:hypothetical protein